MKYRDTYRIVTQISRYVSHRDFRYRATPRCRHSVLFQYNIMTIVYMTNERHTTNIYTASLPARRPPASLPACPLARPPACPPASPPARLPIGPSVRPPVRPSARPSVRPPVRPSARPSVSPPARPSVRLSTCPLCFFTNTVVKKLLFWHLIWCNKTDCNYLPKPINSNRRWVIISSFTASLYQFWFVCLMCEQICFW